MSTIVTRAGKGSPLTNAEVDSNFSNLNTDKLELGGTFSSGTANSILFLNGSKVLTTGSALTFDGTNTLQVNGSSAGYLKGPSGEILIGEDAAAIYVGTGSGVAPAIPINFGSTGTTFQRWQAGGSEQMRLTSTGLGIGTSSPAFRLDVQASGNSIGSFRSTGANYGGIEARNSTRSYSLLVRPDTSNALVIRDETASSNRVVLDSSGNLGLGVTPSAWSVYKAYQVGRGALVNASIETDLVHNAYWNGSNWIYIANDFASRHLQINGQHRFFTAPSGTAGDPISFGGAKMTLDASGKLLLGTTSLVANEQFTMYGAYAAFANASYTAYLGAAASVLSSGSASDFAIRTNNNLVFSAGGADERARITSGGYFKASDDGTYFGSTGTYHEFNQSALADSLIARASNASYASSVLIARALRSQNSAYNLIYCDSGDGADAEFKFTGDGNGYADGTFNNNGADYAEYFESATGDALTVGATVVLDGNKVREATPNDPVSAIMGVVRPKEPSKASMVIGNTAWNKWANKYLTDDFDRYIMEDHEVVEWIDADGKQYSYESHNMPVDVTAPADAVRKTHDDKGNKFQHYKLNPAWNSDAEYTPREKRPEWNIIGLVGQVKVLKGRPVNDRWIKMRDVSVSVEEWMIR